jgi:hypothetical protein
MASGKPSMPAKLELPVPPSEILDYQATPQFARSLDMEDFLREHWIHEGGVFAFTGAFEHLEAAKIGVLWASSRAPIGGSAGQRFTAALAMMYEPRPAKRWLVDLQYWGMQQLFGPELPDFVLIFDAHLWAAEIVSDATKLAIATHELCHCGFAIDEFGEPKVVRKGPRAGQPVFEIKPHDVEEFALPVRWFGAEACGVQEIIGAASREPVMKKVLEQLGLDVRDVQSFGCATCKAA